MAAISVTPIRVFVHLAYGYDADKWEVRWERGEVLGINEPRPYGYCRANSSDVSIEYSRDKLETPVEKVFRLGVRLMLGFDLMHAWRNLKGLRQADVVWTHTESQFLSILFLLRFNSNDNDPKIIAQSVWLFDRWTKFSFLKKYLFSKLIAKADILTVHSPNNLAIARKLFPDIPSEIVLFGIDADKKVKPFIRSNPKPLRIISLGNDEHRDWKLLIAALQNRTDWELKIASRTVKKKNDWSREKHHDYQTENKYGIIRRI